MRNSEPDMAEYIKNLAAVYDSCPIPCAVIQAVKNEKDEVTDFIFIYTNKALSDFEGTNVKSLMGRRYSELPRRICAVNLKSFAAVSMGGGVTYEVEYNPSTDRYLGVWCYNVCDGICICLIADVTENVGREKEYQRQLYLYRTFEQCAVFTVKIDSAFTYLYTNDHYFEMLGYSHEDEKCGGAIGIINPSDVEFVRDTINGAIKIGKDSAEWDMRVIKKSGVTAYWRVSGEFVRQNDNSYIMNGVVIDITDRKLSEIESEKKRKAAEDKYRNTTELCNRLKSNNTVCSFRLNLTENICCSGEAKFPEFLGLKDSGTVDSFFDSDYRYIADSKKRDEYKLIFNRSALLELFAKGQNSVSFDARFYISNTQPEWLRTSALLMQNPETNDIEAYIFSENIEKEQLTKTIVERFAMLEYEFIAMIDINTGKLFSEYTLESAPYMPPTDGDYAAVLESCLHDEFFESDIGLVRHKLSLENIISELNKDNIYNCYFNIRLPDGNIKRKKWQFTYLDETKSIIAYTRSDVTALYAAETDHISGIYNQAAFYHHAAALLNDNPDIEYILIVLDIDRFKVYNDIFGMAEGDKLLAEIGKKLSSDTVGVLRLCGRLEADRFAVITPTDALDFEQIAKEQKKWFAKYRSDYELSPRYGAYKIDDRSLGVNIMCDRALLALQSIKGSSDRHFAWYEDSMRRKLIDEQQLEQDIRLGLDRDEFIVYLQPQYDHLTGKMTGAEALVRWQRPNVGITAPGVFIPIMEHSGLITRLDKIIFEKTCALIRKWQKDNIPVVPISVNLSRCDIYAPGLVETLCDITEKYCVDHNLVRLEVTESAYMENPEQLITVIDDLRAEGFCIEMDDFGSAYSSLNTLKNLPVDMLKLDLKFLSDSIDGRGGIILNSVVQMAHWLNLHVIAEGVETARQADYLKTIDCRYVQGFYYSKSLPVPEFEKLLKNGNNGENENNITVAKFFNSKEFWDPNAQATVVFNTFVGAAGIFEYDGKNVYATRLNDKFYDITGISREDITKHSDIFGYSAPEDLPRLRAALDKASSSEEEIVIESRWIHTDKDRRQSWFRARLRCIAGTENRSFIYVALEDTTERVMLSQNNQNLNEELSGIIGSVPGGITKIKINDGKLEFSYVSDGMCRMFGFNRDEMMADLEKSIDERIHPDDLQKVMWTVEKSLSERQPINMQFRKKCRNGTYKWVDLKSSALEKSGSDLVYYVSYTDITAIKQLEGQLLAEKKTTELVLDNSMISIWDYDIKTKTCRWQYRMKNDCQSQSELTNNVPDSVIDSGLICDDSIENYRALYEAVGRGDEKAEQIIHSCNADGIEMWQKVTYYTRFEGDKPVGATGYSIDVTEHVEKEQRYKREMHYLEEVHNTDLVDKARADITDNVMETYSAAMQTELYHDGMTFTDIVDALADGALTDNQKLKIRSILSREYLNKMYLMLRKNFKIEYQRTLTPGDTPIWVELYIKLYQEPETGHIKAFMYTYCTDEKKLLKAVINSIYDSSFSMIGVLDTQTDVLHTYQVSPLESKIGWAKDIPYTDNLDLFIDTYIVEECRDEARDVLSLDNIRKHLDADNKYNCAFSVMLDGKLHRKKWEFTYLGGDNTKIVYTRSDITELFEQQNEQRKRLKDALTKAKKANAAKTDFLSNMSHDIRTPMNAIVNMSDIIRDDYNGTGKGDVLDDLDKLDAASDYLLGLINNILDMSTIESGKIELHPEVYHYTEFINYIQCIFIPLCEKNGLTFVWEKGNTDLPLYVDKVRFNQIFCNLLSNAVKFTKPGGKITFEVSGNKVENGALTCNYSISDTGCGMSEKFQKHLFKPFECEYNDNRAYNGSGLGLALVKKIVDLMHGKISVKSHPGKGTVFTVSLTIPVATINQLEENQKTSCCFVDNVPLDGKRILIVEDNQLNLNLMKRLLERKGVIVVEVENGKKAVDLFIDRQPGYFDVILMDVRMPVMDGLRATRLIRSAGKADSLTVPIIAMTANAFDEDRKTSREAGMTDYLTKPINVELMYKTIQKYIK